jgi:hypothetical protein
MSGIVCVALDRPVRRLFSTGTWTARFRDLGFGEGVADREFVEPRRDAAGCV